MKESRKPGGLDELEHLHLKTTSLPKKTCESHRDCHVKSCEVITTVVILKRNKYHRLDPESWLYPFPLFSQSPSGEKHGNP